LAYGTNNKDKVRLDNDDKVSIRFDQVQTKIIYITELSRPAIVTPGSVSRLFMESRSVQIAWQAP